MTATAYMKPPNDAVVSITAHVPEDAMSAGLLGTERVGHGVRIRPDGLIATIGYIVHEAENLWIGSRDTVVPGFVFGYDFDSGLAQVYARQALRKWDDAEERRLSTRTAGMAMEQGPAWH